MPSFQPIYNGAVANGDVATARLHRGLTPDIFRGANFYNQNLEHDLAFLEDFRAGIPVASQTLNGGTIVEGAGGDGEMALTSTTTDNQGPQVQFKGCGVVPTAGQTICFETRVKLTGNSKPGNLVFGLSEVNTAQIATNGTLTDLNDYAIFYCLEGASPANSVTFKMEVGSDVASTKANIGVLTNDTYVKFGLRCVVGKSIDIFVNGVPVADNGLVVARFPNAFVCPTFGVESADTTAPVLTVDWFAIAVVDGVTS
jgi:hypothetical protein